MTFATSLTLRPQQKARINQHLCFNIGSLLIIFRNISLGMIVGNFLTNLEVGIKTLLREILKQTMYNNLIEQTARL